jgi:DNA-binding response OmpR family regulator
MRAAGLTSYLVKPFSTDKCIAIVEGCSPRRASPATRRRRDCT